MSNIIADIDIYSVFYVALNVSIRTDVSLDTDLLDMVQDSTQPGGGGSADKLTWTDQHFNGFLLTTASQF